MSYAFTKIYRLLVTSSVWDESPDVCKLWVTMLVLSDRYGRVISSKKGLAHMARLPVDVCEMALNKFLSPDPDSKSKDYEGRRIKEIETGWLILNYEKYRNLRDEEEVKERKKDWYRKNREKILENKRKTSNPNGNEMSKNVQSLTNSDELGKVSHIAEAEAEAEKSSSVSPNAKDEANVFYTKKNQEAVIPTEEEIVNFGQGPSGIPEDFCRYFHAINTEKNAWTDNGRLIQWTKRLVRYWANARANWGKGTSKTGWKNFERTRTMENDHSKGF